jgi:uncharacterized cupin superfamily protein
MIEPSDTKVRVVRAQDVEWEEASRGPEEQEPPGREFTAATSGDERFAFGFWERERQDRRFERPYHEVAFIIEGQVEVTDDNGDVVIAGPGDILITPQGSTGHWKNLSPVRKVWAVYEDPGASLKSYIGPGAF